MTDRIAALRAKFETDLKAVAEEAKSLDRELATKLEASEAKYRAKIEADRQALHSEYEVRRAVFRGRVTEIRNILDSLDAAEPGAPAVVSIGGDAPSEERDLIDPELSRELREPATTLREQAFAVLRRRGAQGLSTRDIIDIALDHGVGLNRESLASMLSKLARTKKLAYDDGIYHLIPGISDDPRGGSPREAGHRDIKQAIISVIDKANQPLALRDLGPRVIAQLRRLISDRNLSYALGRLQKEGKVKRHGRKWGLPAATSLRQAAE